MEVSQHGGHSKLADELVGVGLLPLGIVREGSGFFFFLSFLHLTQAEV